MNEKIIKSAVKAADKDEQQKFQPNDLVRVTMELTVADGVADIFEGTINKRTLDRWNSKDHITVELIERPEPPREPGLYLCSYDHKHFPMRWDGVDWRWPGVDEQSVAFQDDVTVLGTITLNEGVEL